MTNLFRSMESDVVTIGDQGSSLLPRELWEPVKDVNGAYTVFEAATPKFLEKFGQGIVDTVPPGSIFFGGTDWGRFLISAYSQSQSEGRPFFTVTQNGLAAPAYLSYLQDMYGGKINLADTNDLQSSFSNYTADVAMRLRHDKEHPNEPRQIAPGEDIHEDATGHMQVSGQVSVMRVNALLAKIIFDRNPEKEFYVEESFPLDWMFPHLTPAGLILKINRDPVPELSEDTIKADHDFWSKYSEGLVGNWIDYDTPIKEVIASVEKIYLRHDFEGFNGDVGFARDSGAQMAFSKLRSSNGGIYTWRIGMPPSGGVMPPQYIAKGPNRKLIEREADFACKQAFAFCPSSPEAVYRYVQLLVSLRRLDDAMLIARAAQEFSPTNSQFGYLIENLNKMKGQSSSMENIKAEIPQLEKAVLENSTNFTQQFKLAQDYIQIGKNERGYQVLDQVLRNPQVNTPAVMAVADAYNRMNQPRKLQAALEKLTELNPNSPEAWYDLAALRASFGETSNAIESLKKALDLNTKRLTQDPTARDIRPVLKQDTRFNKMRDSEEFKALMLTP